MNGDGYSDVIVGVTFYDNGGGRVFAYHGSPAGLATTPAWTAWCDQAAAGFGLTMGTAGDVNGDGFADVIVGANNYTNGQTYEGRAFVYHGSASGLAPTAAWTAEINQANAEFGTSVATAGDVNGDGFSDVIVGARYYDNGDVNEGGAFVYLGSAAGLGAAPAWSGESNQQAANFGNAVATAGDVNGDGYADVIVGAYRYSNPEGWEGGAFVYHGSPAGLATAPGWHVESGQTGAELGNSVGTAGDVNGDGYADVIVGVHQYDNGQNNEGRALVFHGSATGLAGVASWGAEADQGGFGRSVATAEDVNGDGFSDVIVGAPSYWNGQAAEGAAFVYLGATAGLLTTPAWAEESQQLAAEFGFSVATAGDVNGDGFSDVIVGAPYYDNGEEDEGRAFVYHGAAAGLAISSAWRAESNQALAFFGISVGTAGDVNGDGYSDVVVGAPGYDNGQTDEGRAYVYHGSSSGPAASPAWAAESDQPNSQFGWTVGTAGDVNGDGYSDVIVGARSYANGQTDEGRVFVYHGSPSGLGATPAWTAESDQANARFGFSGTAGDVNGDGYSDVIVGASGHANFTGRAYSYQGSSSGLGTSPAWTADGDQASGAFGFFVGTAGDVNGDGYSDVIVGAAWYSNGQTREGRAYVYHGSAAGLGASPGWSAECDQADAHFGHAVGTAGDVDGDGFSDVIIGAYGYDNGQTDEGRAYVYQPTLFTPQLTKKG